jgi:hypothetical protein
MPGRRRAPGRRREAGDPLRTHEILGVKLQLTLAGVGLYSFGPNPTANLVGAEEGGSAVFAARFRRATRSGCLALLTLVA